MRPILSRSSSLTPTPVYHRWPHYSPDFAALEISLDVSILFSESIALFPLLILLSISSSSSLS
jgi:hypothetical protein